MSTDWDAINKKKKFCILQTLSSVLEELRKHEIAIVTVAYRGGGDSGEYDPCVFHSEVAEVSAPAVQAKMIFPWITWDKKADGFVIEEVVEKTSDLETIVGDLMEAMVELRHPSWFNGSCHSEGEVTLDVEEQSISVHHGSYVPSWDDYKLTVGWG